MVAGSQQRLFGLLDRKKDKMCLLAYAGRKKKDINIQCTQVAFFFAMVVGCKIGSTFVNVEDESVKLFLSIV